ncbi:MAG: insulinase family protein [Ignavibacteria bacterium]
MDRDSINIIGSWNVISENKMEDLREFFGKFYTPENAVISIVGELDYDRTIKLVDKYYGDIKPGRGVVRRI